MLREFAGLLKRGSSIAVVVALAAFAGKASALAYVGEYDPLFTQDFPGGSKWSGNVTIEVPDTVECIPTTDTIVLKSACPGFKLVSATVLLSGDGQADTLAFPNTSTGWFNSALRLVFGSGSSLDAVSFLGSTPAAINGSFDAPVYTTDFVADDAATGTLFFLSFEELTPVLSWGYLAGTCTIRNYRDCYIEAGRSTTDPLGDATAVWSNLTFQQVPEPGSLALLVLALGALGLVRVRKDSAPALG